MNRESISVDITLYSTDESLPLPRTPRHTVNVQYESIFIVRHISSLSTNFQRSLTANILNAYGKSISHSCQKTTAGVAQHEHSVCTHIHFTLSKYFYILWGDVGHRIWSSMLVLSFITDLEIFTVLRSPSVRMTHTHSHYEQSQRVSRLLNIINYLVDLPISLSLSVRQWESKVVKRFSIRLKCPWSMSRVESRHSVTPRTKQWIKYLS